MPLDILRPATVITTGTWGAFENGFPALGGKTIRDVIVDGGDNSWAAGQVSLSQATQTATGELQDLTPGAGKVTGMVIRGRAYRSTNPGDGVELWLGDQGNAARLNVGVTGVLTEYASASITAWTTAAQINALQWSMSAHWLNGTGPVLQVTEVFYDVTWEPVIGGFKAMIVGLLGPLVAVGLAEMPRIAREVFRRSKTRTRIEPAEYFRAWRELREDPRRRYVFAR
jgi:hypothetical protein